MIVTLAGGVGGSKFIKGLASCKEDTVAIINTGDDIERYGLYISPDIDINLYTLANVIHSQGWGFKDETYACQGILRDMLDQDPWFNLGDKDLATHIYRTYQMKNGKKLSEITLEITEKWNIPIRILPMSDEPVGTYIQTPNGRFHFQEYLIKRRMSDQVLAIDLQGIEEAVPTQGVIEAIDKAEVILLAPSNPLVSIGPILTVPGVRSAIKKSQARVVAVSPIVGGKTIKGPADRMMRDLGYEVSPLGIATFYEDILDAIVIDTNDELYRAELEKRSLEVLTTDTIMDSDAKKVSLAKQVLEFAKKQLVP